MKTIEVRIEGISPLLQHRFPEEDQNSKSKKQSATSSDADIEKSLYKLPDGTIYQPAEHIMGALKSAGARFQIPGRRKTTYKNVVSSGFLIIEPIAIPHLKPRWEVDSRPVVNPSTKGRVLRKRPCFRDWALSFRMIVDETEIPVEVLKEMLDLSGRSIGLGDYRPAKGGSFGRFIVSRFDLVK